MDLNVIYDVKIGLNLALHSLWYGVNTFKLFFLGLQKYILLLLFLVTQLNIVHQNISRPSTHNSVPTGQHLLSLHPLVHGPWEPPFRSLIT